MDAVMDVDDDDDGVGEGADKNFKIDFAPEGKIEKEELASKKRFRPVYQDLKQWYARDAKIVRIWKETKESYN